MSKWISVEDGLPEPGQQIFYTDGIYIMWGQYGGVYRGLTLPELPYTTLTASVIKPEVDDEESNI